MAKKQKIVNDMSKGKPFPSSLAGSPKVTMSGITVPDETKDTPFVSGTHLHVDYSSSVESLTEATEHTKSLKLTPIEEVKHLVDLSAQIPENGFTTAQHLRHYVKCMARIRTITEGMARCTKDDKTRTRIQLMEKIQSLSLELSRVRDELQQQRFINNDQTKKISDLSVNNQWYAEEIDLMRKANATEIAVHREVIAKLLDSYRYKGRRTVWTHEGGDEFVVRTSMTVDRSIQNQMNQKKGA